MATVTFRVAFTTPDATELGANEVLEARVLTLDETWRTLATAGEIYGEHDYVVDCAVYPGFRYWTCEGRIRDTVTIAESPLAPCLFQSDCPPAGPVPPEATPLDPDCVADALAAACTLAGNCGSLASTNSAATLEAGEAALPHVADWSNGGDATVWFRWQPTVTGRVVLSTQGSEFETVLAVYTGPAENPTLASLAFVAATDQGAHGDTSNLELEVVAGTTYYVVVNGDQAADRGKVLLSWGSARFVYGTAAENPASATTTVVADGIADSQTSPAAATLEGFVYG